MKRIPLSSPDVGECEERFVLEAMRSGWIAPLGPDVDKFESEMAQRVGVRHAVALSSGTAALHLVLLARGIGSGDTVLTSTMTFVATANAIRYTGASPHFVDCEVATGNMDPAALQEAIDEIRDAGGNIAAVVPVDLLGKAVDYSAICQVSEKEKIPVIADSAESLGAFHRGKPAGSWGDASILSFNGNKIMTTSGGGMVLTNDAALAQRIRYLATQAREPVTHYEHKELGYNYRLSNLLAALGRAQLARLDEMILCRRRARDSYASLFSTTDGVEIFGRKDDYEDNCWLTSILVDSTKTGWTAETLQEWLNQDDIESRPLWKPMHLQPLYRDHGATLTGNSELLYSRGLTLPSGSALSQDDFGRIGNSIRNFLSQQDDNAA